MKLLTLNTHSIIEEDSDIKVSALAKAIAEIKPDVIALQEVNQTSSLPIIDDIERAGVVSMRRDIPIRCDNYAAHLSRLLQDMNQLYHCLWLPIKRGYERLDEGVAILTNHSIHDADIINLSIKDDYKCWKTRKGLGIKLSDNYWYYSLHFGWWDDTKEPFFIQWQRFAEAVYGKKVWAMGDFNSPDSIRDEGYDLMTRSGWYDSFLTAKKKDDGTTVGRSIAGWNNAEKMRIDYILSNFNAEILSSEVMFNGKNRDVISDHFGVLVTVGER